MSRPKQLQIFGENWVTADCAIAVSSGSDSAKYLYDQKPASVWSSSGSNDITTETITIAFYNRFGVACTRNIDRVVLLNTNAKNITVTTSLSGVSTAFGATSNNAEANVIISGSAILCDTVIITITTTQVAGQEKRIGELKACLYLMTANATTVFEREDSWRGGSYRVRSGALVRWREYTKAEGKETISGLTLAQRDLLNAAIADYSFLTFYFYGDFAPAEIYEYCVTDPPTENFDRVTARYELNLSLKER